MFKNYLGAKWYQKLCFSPILIKKPASHKISYVAVFTALLTVCNALLEIKFLDVQFSVTLFLSVMAGIILGAGSGFIACMVGDGLGFMISSWGYVYMPWVGLTSGVTALLAGLIFYFIKLKVKGSIFVKLVVISILSFLIGTIAINSTGFYLYNYFIGFTKSFTDYASARFGGDATFLAYVFYRLFFKGQIFNSLVNYALVLIIVPIIIRTPFFKKDLSNGVLDSKEIEKSE